MSSFLANAFLEVALCISIAPGGYTPFDQKFSAAAAGGVEPPGHKRPTAAAAAVAAAAPHEYL